MNCPPWLGAVNVIPSVAAPGVAIAPEARAERERETLGAKSGNQEEG